MLESDAGTSKTRIDRPWINEAIDSVSLIPWEVDSKSVIEPTKSLYPTPNG